MIDVCFPHLPSIERLPNHALNRSMVAAREITTDYADLVRRYRENSDYNRPPVTSTAKVHDCIAACREWLLGRTRSDVVCCYFVNLGRFVRGERFSSGSQLEESPTHLSKPSRKGTTLGRRR